MYSSVSKRTFKCLKGYKLLFDDFVLLQLNKIKQNVMFAGVSPGLSCSCSGCTNS